MKKYLSLIELREVVEKKFGPLHDEHYSPKKALNELYDKADEMASKNEYGLCRDSLATGLYFIEYTRNRGGGI